MASEGAPIEFLLLCVLENPGCTTRQALRQAGVSKARFYRSLKTLVDAGRLVSIQHRNAKRLFPAWPGITDVMPQALALQNEKPRRLFLLLHLKGPMPRSKLMKDARETLKFPPRAAERYLSMLCQAGLVQDPGASLADRRHANLKAIGPSLPLQNLLLGPSSESSMSI